MMDHKCGVIWIHGTTKGGDVHIIPFIFSFTAKFRLAVSVQEGGSLEEVLVPVMVRLCRYCGRNGVRVIELRTCWSVYFAC